MGRLVGGIVLFLIGLVVFVVARVNIRQQRNALSTVGKGRGALSELWKLFQFVGAALSVLALFVTGSAFVRIVPANTVGIPTTFGKVGAPLNSGFHITAPWTEITGFSTRIQELSMLRAADEGDKSKDDSISVIASGGGSMKVDVTVRFSVAPDQADELFRLAGSIDLIKDRFVRPDTREVVRNIFGEFTAEQGYSTERAKIATQVTDQLAERLARRGILVDSVNVRDVLPEQQVLDAINAVLQTRNQAAQALEDQKKQVTEAQTRKQVATLDKEAAITKAEAEAQAVSIAAQAQAEANQKIAASLSPELVQLEIAKACADAIAKTGAQVVNVCGTPGGTGGAIAAPTSVIVDSRNTNPAPPTTVGG
jgi:regulator of protease activity HflC (stomatin/prohibitin superfamily)